ncbi:MAG: hypothetical protein IPM45_01625 [Acidimicrobiales bacterium]|nr:hypothetical protein [Acidimicrobiales bacterium]
MSEIIIFVIGAVIFAITVYGSVMAGGLALTRLEVKENDAIGPRVDRETVSSVPPTESEQ